MTPNPLYKNERILPAGMVMKKLHPFRGLAAKGTAGWCIGHGHTRTAKEGLLITQDQADQLLHDDLVIYAKAVKRLVTVPLGLYQFNALVVFCAHSGVLVFEKSNLLYLLNRKWYDQVPAQLRRFGKEGPMKIRKRRDAEIELWNRENQEDVEERVA